MVWMYIMGDRNLDFINKVPIKIIVHVFVHTYVFHWEHF